MKRRRTGTGRMARLAALLAVLAACGSRTGLFVDGAPGAGSGEDDGGPGGGRNDGGFDAPVEDAPPPLDATFHDADRTGCPDASTTYVYLISEDYHLYSFDPSTSAITEIGSIVCPALVGTTPFSMAVDRKGVAYVLYNDGHLFRVSTATAACVATSFAADQAGFDLFGMGFATNAVGPTETLFVAGTGDAVQGMPSADGLARIDVGTFKLTPVAGFTPKIRRAELTGTGDGRLFGFYTKTTDDAPTYIGEIDTQNGRIVGEAELDGVQLGRGWAFAFWGGAFYTFTAPNQVNSRITRYRPQTGTVDLVTELPTIIVGAGVSTCAPQQ